MTQEKRFESLGIKLSVFDNWVVAESATEVTLRPRGPGGAITVSTYGHEDACFRADAVEQCSRFVASLTKRDVEINRSGAAAIADFRDEQGVWWVARVLTHQNRFALATYNSGTHLGSEASEARAILNSVIFD